jgi:hypothetical protein
MTLKKTVSASFVVGNTTTNSFFLQGGIPVGIIFSGSTISASNVTVLVSMDNSNFYPLYDETSEINISASSVARAYSVNWTKVQGWNYMKLRLGNSASAVAQKLVDSLVQINII